MTRKVDVVTFFLAIIRSIANHGISFVQNSFQQFLMSQRPSLQTRSRQTIAPQQLLILSLGIVALLASLGGILYWNQEKVAIDSFEKEFYFSPVENNFFENPANWLPEYPGTTPDSQSRLIIQGLAYLTDYDLKIKGELVISMDGQIFSSKGGIHIAEGASLVNEGELILHHLINEGKLVNQLASELQLVNFQSSPNSVTQNLRGAHFAVRERLLNQGIFDNYGQCDVQTDFFNEAIFNHLQGGELLVQGKIQ